MAYEQKNNTFSAFKNQKKEKKEHADLTGTMLLDGKEYWVNIWKKTDKNNNTWLSGSVRPKVKDAKKEAPPSRQTQKEDFEEEVPF